MCSWVLNGLEMLVGLDLQAGYGLDLVLNKVVETISFTSKGKLLALPWRWTLRLDFGVRVRKHIVRDSLKHWNDSFFYVDDSVFPLFVPWYTKKKVTRDPSPTADEFSAEASDFLTTHQAQFWKFSGSFLCLVGISRYYELDDNVYPDFLADDDEEMDLFAFINHTDPTKVRIAEKQIEEGQVPLLESTRGRVVLLAGDEEVNIVVNEEVEATAADKPKGSRKKRKAAGEHSTLAVEVGVTAVATVPFVTSSVTLTPEHEGGGRTDFITGPNLRTQHPAKRFVISLDSPCHSSSNVADAEVSSVVRSLVLDPHIMTTTVATKVVVDTSSVPVPKAGNEPVYHTLFADSASTGEARHDITFAAVKAAKGDRANELDGLKARNLVHEGKRLSSDELNVKAASLESQKDNLASQDEHVKILSDKVSGLDAEFMGMALHLDKEFYPRFWTTIAGQRWILSRGLKLVVMKCLQSSEYLIALGEAISRAIDKGMQNRLEAGIDHGRAGRSLVDVAAYDPSAEAKYVSAVHALRGLDFPLLSQLESQKDASIADIMSLLHLEGPAAENLEASQLIRGDAASCCLSLYDAMVPLIKPLSAENLVGEASTTSYVPSILVLDYDVLDAEPQTEAPPFASVVFEKEELETAPHDQASKRSKSSCDGCWIAKSWITCVNTNGNTTLSEAQGVSLRITSSFHLRPPAKGIDLRVADSHTGNHPKDDFTPLETIQRPYSVIRKRIPFELEGETFKPERARLGRYPTSVRIFHDPILFLAGLKSLWEHGQQCPAILVGGKEMAFRNFIYTEDDEDLSFLPKEPSSSLDTGSPSILVNTETLKPDKELVNQPAEITADSGESPKPKLFVVHPGSVAARIKDRKCKTRGVSSRPPAKRKLAPGSLTSHTKTSSSKEDVPFLTVLAVVDNAINRRSNELLQVIQKMRGEFDVMRSRKRVREEECEWLRVKCKVAMTKFEKNFAVMALREKIFAFSTKFKEHKLNLDMMMLESQKWAGYQQSLSILDSKLTSLEAEKARLEAVKVSLRKEVEKLKQYRREVVSKVVPYAAMELVHSDDMGSLVGKLVSSIVFHGRCRAFEQVVDMKEPFDLSKVKGYRSSYKKDHTQASNDLATATFPWLDEFLADPSAPIEALLLKKPPTL
ncbi:hypothetical protein Tco_0794655 [Tanacetum coccineum]